MVGENLKFVASRYQEISLPRKKVMLKDCFLMGCSKYVTQLKGWGLVEQFVSEISLPASAATDVPDNKNFKI